MSRLTRLRYLHCLLAAVWIQLIWRASTISGKPYPRHSPPKCQLPSSLLTSCTASPSNFCFCFSARDVTITSPSLLTLSQRMREEVGPERKSGRRSSLVRKSFPSMLTVTARVFVSLLSLVGLPVPAASTGRPSSAPFSASYTTTFSLKRSPLGHHLMFVWHQLRCVWKSYRREWEARRATMISCKVCPEILV